MTPVCAVARLVSIDTIARMSAALVLDRFIPYRRGLLARDDNPADKRSHLLRLTGAGRNLYEAVAPKALELERLLFAAFPPRALRRFVTMLRWIEQCADEMQHSVAQSSTPPST